MLYNISNIIGHGIFSRRGLEHHYSHEMEFRCDELIKEKTRRTFMIMMTSY